MKEQEKWNVLVARLLSVGDFLDKQLSTRSDVPTLICRALFLKAIDTLRGIQLLYQASLPVQAQVLVRVLLELRMDLDIFLGMLAENPENAARRIIDAMMLEKVKQQRESNFAGLEYVEGAPKREEFLELEKEIVGRYGKHDADRMRRYGFSGVSVEERARKTGLSDLYHVVYRNFSRNVHATDYMEHLRATRASGSTRWPDYEDSRDHVALSSAITCVWQMVSLLDLTLRCGLDAELEAIWKVCSSFEHWVSVPSAGESALRRS